MLTSRYMLDIWMLTYQGGFRRRALLGSLVRAVAGHEVPWWPLQLILLLVTIALLACIALSLLSLSRSLDQGRLVLLLAAASPVFSVFFEHIGDPLQICLLLVLATLWLVRWLGERRRLIGAVVLASIGLSACIHEASLFLTAPAYLVLLARPAIQGYRRRYGLMLIVLALVVALYLAVFHVDPSAAEAGASNSLQYVNNYAGKVYSYSGSLDRPFFSYVWAEYESHFSSWQALLGLPLRVFRVALVPMAFLGLISYRLPSLIQQRLLVQVWMALAVTSFPLYVIAHDWGRFAIHTLVVTLFVGWFLLGVVAAPAEPLLAEAEAEADAEAEAGRESQPRGELIGWSLMVMVFVAYPISTSYRISGIPEKPAAALLYGLVAGIVAFGVSLSIAKRR